MIDGGSSIKNRIYSETTGTEPWIRESDTSGKNRWKFYCARNSFG
jgi:hypothetical protein